MKRLILLCLVALVSGCAATGTAGGCAGPGACPDATRLLMNDVIHHRPFGP